MSELLNIVLIALACPLMLPMVCESEGKGGFRK